MTVKKIFIHLFLCLFVTLTNKAQNLVPNYSFENYTSCPSVSSQIYLASPWIGKDNNSVEYYNSCSSTKGVPKHGLSFQYAKTGNAYAGLWAYNGVGNNYREYLQVQLNSVLINNKCYLVTFYVNTDLTKYAVNSIGAYLSSDTICSTTGIGAVLSFTPQIIKFGNPILNDTLNWIKITGIVNSLNNEKYITIGNFNFDNNTDTLSTNYGTYPGAYYNIDDVSVIPIDSIIGGMATNAGPDKSIAIGDSIFIGQEISNLNCNWTILGGAQIATNTSGIYVKPASPTTYVVEQNLCGNITNDTVYVMVSPTGIKEYNELQNSFSIYPNPSSGTIFISTHTKKDEKINIVVTNLLGEELYTAKDLIILNGMESINLNIVSGTYLVKITNTRTDEKIIKKIIIQK